MSRERPTPYGGAEALALENARLRSALQHERRRAAALARSLEEAERRAVTAAEESRRRAEGHARDVEERLRRILSAWTDEGPMPRVHRQAQREVRHLMPVLVRRIEHALRRL